MFKTRRVIAAACLAIAPVLLLTSPALAHSEVLSASPSPGDGLAQAPGVVVMKFSERLNPRLSHIEVVDRTDRDLGGGETQAVPGDSTAMRRRLGLLTPGRYTVRWTTVSAVDGHALKGSYTFGIGTSTLGNEHVSSGPLDSQGLAGVVGRFVGFAGLSLWFGSLALGGVASRAGVSKRRLSILRVFGPVLALVGTIASLLSSTIIATGSLRALDEVLLDSQPGRWQLVVLATAFLGLLLVLRPPTRLRAAGGVAFAMIAVTADAASGHAAGTASPTLATVSLTVHLLAVATWLFALTAVLFSWPALRRALATFAPPAFSAAIAVAATGIINSLLELDSVGDLTSTGYGKVILIKTLLLVSMVALGVAHSIVRRMPNVELGDLRNVVRSELGAGLLALVLAALLVAYPNPPREEANAVELAAPVSLHGLSGRDAVSVADASGPFIVGLSVSPAQPGPVRLQVQVVGVEAGDALRNARVRATPTTGGSTLELRLQPCGLGCFEGRSRIPRGEWRLDTQIATNREPIAVSVVIPLPAPSGRAALDRTIAAMQQLRSLLVNEQLRGAANSELVVTEYRYQAPDAFSFSMNNGYSRITLGRQDFDRDKPDAPWRAGPVGGEGFRWPAHYYRDIWTPATAVRVLGTESVDETPTRVIAFFRPDVGAWFRLWIDHTGLVRRMEMRAEGHIMSQHYSGFDAPIEIVAPIFEKHARS